MKQSYEFTVRLPEDLLRRLLYLCEAEGRTPSAEVNLLLRNTVSYFERAKGKMDTKRLAAYDVSSYLAASKNESVKEGAGHEHSELTSD